MAPVDRTGYYEVVGKQLIGDLCPDFCGIVFVCIYVFMWHCKAYTTLKYFFSMEMSPPLKLSWYKWGNWLYQKPQLARQWHKVTRNYSLSTCKKLVRQCYLPTIRYLACKIQCNSLGWQDWYHSSDIRRGVPIYIFTKGIRWYIYIFGGYLANTWWISVIVKYPDIPRYRISELRLILLHRLPCGCHRSLKCDVSASFIQ